jgi:hypothetical protein
MQKVTLCNTLPPKLSLGIFVFANNQRYIGAVDVESHFSRRVHSHLQAALFFVSPWCGALTQLCWTAFRDVDIATSLNKEVKVGARRLGKTKDANV